MEGIDRMIEVTLPIKIVSVLNEREHHMARYRRTKAHRKASFMVPKPRKLPCIITLTRIAPRKMDAHDNLRAGFKALVDGIAERIGVDDRDPRIEWRYKQERGEPKQYAARVTIEDAP